MEAQNAGLSQLVNANGGSQQEGQGLNSKFKIIKQLEAESRHSIKNLAPHAKAVREFGGIVGADAGIGQTQINTAESTKIQAEVGKGSIFDIVL